MSVSETPSYYGHRARMRERLLAHGVEVMPTYELLEMLLYYAVPYRDTKPLAKALLERFDGLDGVLRASEELLQGVTGVGASCARYLGLLGKITLMDGPLDIGKGRVALDTYFRAGGFLSDYFKRNQRVNCVALLLDSSMRLLGTVVLPGDNFGSASVKPGAVIDASLRLGASAAVIGFTHRRPLLMPTSADLATAAMLKGELGKMSVSVVEQFMVFEDTYFGLELGMKQGLTGLGDSALRFWDTVSAAAAGGVASLCEASSEGDCSAPDEKGEMTEAMLELMRSAGIKRDLTEGLVQRILSEHGSLKRWLISGDLDILPSGAAHSAGVLRLLLRGTVGRRYTDLFTLERRHSESELAYLLEAMFYGCAEERLCVICYDAWDRVIALDQLGCGTVGEVAVTPRKILETGLRHKAASLSVAHNHPGGVIEASKDDMDFTEKLFEGFIATRVALRAHYVVAEGGVIRLTCDERGRIGTVSQILDLSNGDGE